MQKVVIYHGSQIIVEKPAFGEGNPRNDYGLGFYCTHEMVLAKEWACSEESSGYANQYELDMTGFSVMHLSGADYNILNWLAVLLNNRSFRISNDIATEGKEHLLGKFLPDTRAYDVIIGYRANDSYFSFANAFLNNALSLAQLEMAMYLGKLGEQTVLKSKQAFEQIRYISSEAADREIYYPMKNARDREARLAYRRERGRERERAVDAVYLMDILRGGWDNDDARIRRNIPG
jgi:hypothetical protein